MKTSKNKWGRSPITPFLMLIFAARLFGQTGGMGLNPARLELEILPGHEKTTAFEIEAPPSESVVRGRLLLSLTDWDINEDGSLRYADPSTMPDSASSWIVFSPSAVTIASGQSQMVRITVRVPKDVAPGVYRAGLFVQERPPATPAKKGEHLFYLRVRYVFTLYVTVPPVSKRAEIVAVQLVPSEEEARLLYELKNNGTSHVRPLVSLSVRGEQNAETMDLDHESIVLLPGKTLKHSLPIPNLSPGDYEVYVEVDFQDGGALQSIRRKVHISEASLTASGSDLQF